MLYLPTILRSFYDPSVYREVRYQRSGYGLQYALVLLCWVLLIELFVAFPALNRVHEELFVGTNGRISVMDDVFRQLARQVPLATYQDGRLATEIPQPTKIRLHTTIMGKEVQGDVITIDTTGTITHRNFETPFLITAEEIIGKDDKKIEIHSFREMDEKNLYKDEPLHISPDTVMPYLEMLSDWLKENLATIYIAIASLLLPMLLIGFYIVRVALLMVLALSGILLRKIIGTPAPWEQLMRLASLGVTPIAVLSIGSLLIYGTQPGTYTWLGCGVLMLAVGLYVTKQPKDAPAQ